MLTDQEIQELLVLPKQITKRDPAKGYKEEGSHKRCNLVLESSDAASVREDFSE